MPKRRVDVRLEEDLLEWADDYAAQRRWDRTTLIVAALEGLRDDAKRGVPDAPAPPPRQALVTVPVSDEPVDPRRRLEPQVNWFGTLADHRRALARFNSKGEW